MIFLLNPLLYILGLILSVFHPYHFAITLALLGLITIAVRAKKSGNSFHFYFAIGTVLLWRLIHLAVYLLTHKRIDPELSTYTWNLGEGMPSVAQAGWPSPLMLPPGAGGADAIPFSQLIWAYHNEMAALLIGATLAFLLAKMITSKKSHLTAKMQKSYLWITSIIAVLAHLAFSGMVVLWFD